MDDFCRLNHDARKPYFQTAADKMGVSQQIIEKDFWVCWTLRRLFRLPGVGEHLIFKGGTSLSKVFGIIDRFSEDVDVSIHRTFFGFKDDRDPETAKSGKQTQKLIEELAAACSDFVKNDLIHSLRKSVAESLGTADGWSIEIDPADPDGQTLLFIYPGESTKQSYIPPRVKIEMGARSDNWPAHAHAVQPYISDHLPGSLKDPATQITTLDATRTFWEKATILHSHANLPEGKLPQTRQSRHYYDLYRLLKSGHRAEAMKKLDLLKRVAEHKSVYYRSARAKYEEAAPGTLKLVPSVVVHDELKRDYAQMSEMFFKTPPTWDEIIAALRDFETEVNGSPPPRERFRNNN